MNIAYLSVQLPRADLGWVLARYIPLQTEDHLMLSTCIASR